eukprot:gene42297-52443_t
MLHGGLRIIAPVFPPHLEDFIPVDGGGRFFRAEFAPHPRGVYPVIYNENGAHVLWEDASPAGNAAGPSASQFTSDSDTSEWVGGIPFPQPLPVVIPRPPRVPAFLGPDNDTSPVSRRYVPSDGGMFKRSPFGIRRQAAARDSAWRP